MRWVALSVATLSTVVVVTSAVRLLTGLGPFARLSPAFFALLVGVALLFFTLVVVSLGPNPTSVRPDATGLAWEERSGRVWRTEWKRAPMILSIGYTESPFGDGADPRPAVVYWVVYRHVRNIAISHDAFTAIRAAARTYGLGESMTRDATRPTSPFVRIRFSFES